MRTGQIRGVYSRNLNLCAKELVLRFGVFSLSVQLKLVVTPNFVYLQTGTIVIMNWLPLVLPRIMYL
ncbi:hypothetical protein C8R48DRAFT_703613, partial [Suillus tomentosus]